MENSIFLRSVIEATIISNIIWASELRVSQYKALEMRDSLNTRYHLPLQ